MRVAIRSSKEILREEAMGKTQTKVLIPQL